MNAVRPAHAPEGRECSCFPYVESRAQDNSAVARLERLAERATACRNGDPVFARWAAGYGPIRHSDLTQIRVYELAGRLVDRGIAGDRGIVYERLAAADRIASAGMWLVVHMTYTQRVYVDNRELRGSDFKPDPEGHTGGALNMVPAYTGYLAANALTNVTRSWVMGQGHCVAAIDAVNVIVGNMYPAHAERYDLSEVGLTRLANDFYSYEIGPDGRPMSPLGSHVNPHTAGGLIEGGYLGFAELQYPHMPLPGERLVAFLSDGAFEEQRGSDWASRWWRADDCGAVVPIMVMNGRRIEQRSELAQDGGTAWFRQHLKLNRFDPVDIDGRDPAAYAWAILESEERLAAASERECPVLLPYVIAETVKGYGFPGAGTNHAHNLPLGTNPAHDAEARRQFNEGARRLWVPFDTLHDAVTTLNNHAESQRPRERDHPLAGRDVALPNMPEPQWRDQAARGEASPMDGIDRAFSEIVKANPGLRPRVGNPDELRSNHMNATLDILKHRVTHPELGIAEAVNGAVITALNEEAVVSAALANKGGINIVVTYEAFAVKMLGAIRQELIFSRHQREAGRPPRWLSLPVIATSHTWENGKNEQSHQDPTFCEALLGEMTDVSRVVFPADWNSAVAALRAAYSEHGTVWTLTVPKRPVTDRFTVKEASSLVAYGAGRILGTGSNHEPVLFAAIGAYQLGEAVRASKRMSACGVPNSVIYILEPGRFREPRDAAEARRMTPAEVRAALFPENAQARVILTHTRPEPMAGLLRPLDTGSSKTRVLGYLNRGGTLDTAGLLFSNRCTWAHAVVAAAEALGSSASDFLTAAEVDAVRGAGHAEAIIGPEYP